MKLFLRLMLGFTILCPAAPSPQAQMTAERQAQPQTHEPSPREVVERLWSMAMEGDLLKPDKEGRTARLFTQPGEVPKTRKFRVISNSYWVDRPQFQGTTARVDVGYDEIGSIDSALRFTPAPSSGDPCMIKMAVGYELVFGPSYTKMFAADGKTLLEEKAGYPEWRIKGSPPAPWTTVNTAIRYVLERRRKATDPTIRQNADKTIATLLRYH